MSQSFLDVNGRACSKERYNCVQIGYATLLMTKSRSHVLKPLLYVQSVIIPGIQHKQIKFYFNALGDVVGYVVWATLSLDVEDRIVRTSRMDLHPSEWNEGDRLWIIDLLVPFGNIDYVLRDLRDSVFIHWSSAKYFRAKKKSPLVTMTRRHEMSFFSGSIPFSRLSRY